MVLTSLYFGDISELCADRGIKSGRFQVLLQSKMPAVLIECGFLSNDKECEKLKDATYQEREIVDNENFFPKSHP